MSHAGRTSLCVRRLEARGTCREDCQFWLVLAGFGPGDDLGMEVSY